MEFIYIYIYMYIYIYIYTFWLFETFDVVFRTFRKYIGIDGVFCTINYYFELGIRIRCIFLYIWTYFKVSSNFGSFFRSVNNLRTTDSLFYFVGFLVPPPHPRRQCQSSLPGGNKYGKTQFCIFLFLWKNILKKWY